MHKKGQKSKRRCKATMNKYELALVVNAKVEDEERIATLEAAKDIITRFGGTVTNVEDWGKKKLAYEIQKMNEGYYYFIQFDADSTVPGEVEQRVRILEKVIRYLCVKKNA
jgi:small subunit ribosomal protein S6